MATEGKGFLEVRNGKETDAEAFQLGGDVLVAVAIGVRLDDGDDAGARREGGADCRNIRFKASRSISAQVRFKNSMVIGSFLGGWGLSLHKTFFS